MDENSRDNWSHVRRAFYRAADRRTTPRYELYLRDVHALSPHNTGFEDATDRKAGFVYLRDS